MAHNLKNFHRLLSTVPDSLLTDNGYNVKALCNQNGPLNAEGTAIVPGDMIIFEGKLTGLESAFDAFVVDKNKNHQWAKEKLREASWRS